MLSPARSLCEAASPPTDAPLPNGRVLVVDDAFNNRDILCRRLRRRGFEPVEACGGLDALRLIEAETFDVVLLDIMMPDMTGIDVLIWIRKRFSASALPVIMVTGKAESTDIVEALDAGANDYITKPVNLPVVLSRVSTQVERRRTALALERSNETLASTIEHLSMVNERLQEEVSRRIASEKNSVFLAYHDALTGLANRHAYDERLPCLLSEAQASGRQLAVLFLDLDRFKNVNDALGHSVGDALLRSVAAILRERVGQVDFVARLGGDEFCIVHVSGDAKAGAIAMAEEVIARIEGRHFVKGQQIFIGVSIGIAIADENLQDASDMLKRADLAMYQAKCVGRSSWKLFEPAMDEAVQKRHAMETDLRKALACGELEVFYQPIVDAHTTRTTGYEALLRWRRNSCEYVSPDQFVPLAEETGLIDVIGDWVLRQACEQASRWPADLHIAVNISPVQFRNRHLVTSVMRALSASGLQPNRLELELTESVLLDDNPENLRILSECRQLGVRLSLDDFGTGYSSLGYFKVFRFDKVKIDRSFISGLGHCEDSRAIVRAVVALASSFGMTTIAEGVETDEQAEFVRDAGCQEIQGYRFGSPQPVGRLDRVIAASA